jgi:hypothetical protein
MSAATPPARPTGRSTPGLASVTRLPTPSAAPAPTSVQGALALDTTPRLDPPPPPPSGAQRPGDVVALEPASRARLDAWVHRYLQAVVEIVSGDRPITQLLRWTEPDVYAALGRRAALVARAGGHVAGRGRSRGAVRPAVLGVHTTLVSEGAVEACVHVRHGHRSRAVAARFELIRDRWQCVALELG